MQGRLNIFQETMLHWNDLHPYNAVHVARVPRRLDEKQLSTVVRNTMRALGLSRLTLDRAGGCFQYEGRDVPPQIRIIAGDKEPRGALETEIAGQLNTPFAWEKPFEPVRFFAVTDGDGFFLGLVYFHAIADAEPVVFLLRRLAEAYIDTAVAEDKTQLNLYPPRDDSLIRRNPAVFFQKLLALPGHIRALRQTARARYQDANDTTNSFVLFTLSPAQLRSLLLASKQWEVTVNDVLLALLLRSIAPLRKASSKRPLLTVGCIVNARGDAQLPGERCFGLYLGSFVVSHPVPEGIGLRGLAREVSAQTKRIKRGKLYLGAAMEMAFARRILSFYSTERRRKLYQKHYPLWGGVTNMNLNTLWPQPEGSGAFDYFRAVSTGPVTPLVLSVTTVGDHANIGLSYRSTVYSEADVEGIRSRMFDHISEMESAA